MSSVTHLVFLSPGDEYNRRASCRLPDRLEGEYRIVVETPGTTNPRGVPYEVVFTTNNSGVSGTMEVTLAPPPDLIVESISLPETGIEGQVIDVEWTVSNNGLADATGPWTDRVYLRKVGGTGAGTLIGTSSYAGPRARSEEHTSELQTLMR